MKMKLAVAFAVLFFATIARADSTEVTVDITVTNCLCGPFVSEPPINMTAQLTVEPATGTWFYPGEDYFSSDGPIDEVVAITGTLNGFPITFLQAPLGSGSWINP